MARNNTIEYIYKAIDRMSGPIKSATRSVKKLDAAVIKANFNQSLLGKGVSKSVGLLKSKLGWLSAAAGGGFGLVKFFTVGSRFQDAMLELSAVTGATGKDFEFIKDKALSLGRATKTYQDEVAQGMTMIASLKPELLKNLPALANTTEAILTLKNAAGIEMVSAVDAVVKSLNIFGQTADQTKRFTNIMAAGQKLGSSMIAQTGVAAVIAGGQAKDAGLDFAELNALIQTAAFGGYTGEKAGTAIGMILSNIQTIAKIDVKKLGVVETFKLIKKHVDAIPSSVKRAEVMKKLFGEHQKVAIPLLENIRLIEKFNVELRGTSFAQEQADKRMRAISARWRGLWIVVQEKIINTFDRLEPKISTAIDAVVEWVDTLTDKDIDEMSSKILKFADDFVIVTETVVDLIKEMRILKDFFGEGIATGKALVTGGRIDFSLERLKSDMNKYFGTSFKLDNAIPENQLGKQSAAIESKSVVDVNVRLDAPQGVVRSVETFQTGRANVGVNAP